MSNQTLAQRTTSAIPCSIGTSLALESIFNGTQEAYDPAREIPQRINISDYEEFWINLSTLFRNIIGSLPKDAMLHLFARDIATTIHEEIDLIVSLVKDSNPNTKLTFYACDYSVLQHKYANKHVAFRTDNTDGQKFYSKLLGDTLKVIFKPPYDTTLIKSFKAKLVPNGKPKALILTHCAYDLTSSGAFKDLHLIESHSGKLKTKAQWYTKYSDGKDLVMIPFLEGLLPVFGDNEIFRSMGYKVKKEIIDLAKEKNWTSVTTKEKVLFDIKTLKNTYLVTILETFFKV